MDRRPWQAPVHGVAESDMTEELLLSSGLRAGRLWLGVLRLRAASINADGAMI